MAVLTSDTINQRETKIANMKGTVMCFLEFYDVKTVKYRSGAAVNNCGNSQLLW